MIDLIITYNEQDDTIDAFFKVFQLDRDATAPSVKNEYIKLCLRCHPDNNIPPSTYIEKNILNQANIYFDDYFYYVDNQVIEIQESDYDSDMEETHKQFISKNKFKANIKVLNLGGKFKDTEEYFIPPDNWLDLHTFQNESGSNLVRKLDTLFCCAEKTPMELFV